MPVRASKTGDETMQITKVLLGLVVVLLAACAGPGGPGSFGVTIVKREPAAVGSHRPNNTGRSDGRRSMGAVLICSNERGLVESVRRGTLAQVLSRHYRPAKGCRYDIPGDGRDIRSIGYATTRDGFDVRLFAFRYEGTRVVWFSIQPPDALVFRPRREKRRDRTRPRY